MTSLGDYTARKRRGERGIREGALLSSTILREFGTIGIVAQSDEHRRKSCGERPTRELTYSLSVSSHTGPKARCELTRYEPEGRALSADETDCVAWQEANIGCFTYRLSVLYDLARC
eukprot:sb/3476537/